ncbi:hypothetical protein ACFSKL_02400 [Belliella marina]|uniref:Uncharacterized protein n=1 Tax=Belliella marina TaxID=1644146 RepID=A0ABW4VJD7_9BACT
MIVFLLLSFAWIAFRYWGLHKKYKNYASYFAHNQLYAFMNLGINFCIQGHFFLYRKDEALENTFGQAFLGGLTLVISLLFIGILILPRVLDRNISDTEKLIEIYGESEKTK